jgi:methionyl-tRNA synthetase
VRFQTGTDEHGLKMAQAARAEGVEPRAFANKMSRLFQDMCDIFNVSYDRFILTSEPEHYRASQAIWRAMEERGDLYLGRYEGWYSVRDEAYYDETELVSGDGGEKLSPNGTPVEWTVEESWFFKLSAYQDKLLDHYSANPEFIRPESRRNEVVRFVEGGLSDLSISRTSFDWGVPVPGSGNHVMYVWLDALTNYITGLGYPDDTELWRKYWPADVHLIGKDVVRFHAVYWPAFLMSAGIALPKQVYGHGFLLSRGEKMSKSVGNVVDPMVLAERFGVDALRYFLLREVTFGQDGSYSAEAIVNRANAELANSFGNLAQRVLTQIVRTCGGGLPEIHGHNDADNALFDLVCGAAGETMPAAYADLALSKACEAWIHAVFACNAYIDEQAPWVLRKTDPERMETVLATLFICIAILAVAIRPVIPGSADRLLDAMGVDPDLRSFEGIMSHWYSPLAESEFRLAPPTPLFPRLELEEEEAA